MKLKKILIIDDEVDITNNIKAILNDENYNSSTANNSIEAINLLNNDKFDLVILDVWLDDSELDGIELLKKIRETSSIPIIIISIVILLLYILFLYYKYMFVLRQK